MGENTPRRGLYVPLDVNYREDPKIIEAGPEAELVYLRSLVLAKRLTGRDGHVHRAHLPGLCCDLYSVAHGEYVPGDIAGQLVAGGLWVEDGDGWLIAAWLKHNPSAAEIDESRSAEATRKANWRKGKRPATPDTDNRDEVSHGTERDATDSKREEKTDTETDGRERKRATSPPKDFQPTEEHERYAREHGLNVTGEVDRWLTDCEAKGRTYKVINAGFTTWLHHAVDFGRGGKAELAKPRVKPPWVCVLGNPECVEGYIDFDGQAFECSCRSEKPRVTVP